MGPGGVGVVWLGPGCPWGSGVPPGRNRPGSGSRGGARGGGVRNPNLGGARGGVVRNPDFGGTPGTESSEIPREGRAPSRGISKSRARGFSKQKYQKPDVFNTLKSGSRGEPRDLDFGLRISGGPPGRSRPKSGSRGGARGGVVRGPAGGAVSGFGSGGALGRGRSPGVDPGGVSVWGRSPGVIPRGVSVGGCSPKRIPQMTP